MSELASMGIINPHHSTAGASELRKYKQSHHYWLRKTRWIRWVLLLTIAAVAVITVGSVHGDWLVWALGLVAGVLVCFYVFVRDFPPEFIERHAWGSEAERRTARELESLRSSGYLVRHDIRTKWGNWDHVVVGPGGVFLIDTKSLGGSVGVGEDTVFVVRSNDPRDNYSAKVGSKIRGQAFQLKEEIQSQTGVSVWIQGIACFWNEFAEGVHEEEKVVYIHGSKINEWIQARPQQLHPRQYRAVVQYLGVVT